MVLKKKQIKRVETLAFIWEDNDSEGFEKKSE